MTAEHYGQPGWSLVDVAARRSIEGFAPYVEPPPLARPAIRSYLPKTSSTFQPYASRVAMVSGLLSQVGGHKAAPGQVIVISGQQGAGKSLLAGRLAAAADHNAGWFLAANDYDTLISSLARAERNERHALGADITSAGEKPDAGEERSLAAAALARLRDSLAPWVVVLDNCDQDPRGDVGGVWPLLPVPRALGQTLIVTTTNDVWLRVAREQRWRSETLPPLTADDLLSRGVSRQFHRAVAGRPLVAESLAQLLADSKSVTLEVTNPGVEPEDGPALMWEVFRRVGQDRQAEDVARTVAWCPTDGVDVTAIPGVGDVSSTAWHVLVQSGLVSPQTSGTRREVLMHRLVAAAIREQTWREARAEAVAAVHRVTLDREGRRLLLRASDQTALKRLEVSEVYLAAAEQPPMAAALWHALGNIRERRGPVSRSADHFRLVLAGAEGSHDRAMAADDPERHRLAESLMGIARVTFQKLAATLEDLTEAAGQVTRAATLPGPLGRPRPADARTGERALPADPAEDCRG